MDPETFVNMPAPPVPKPPPSVKVGVSGNRVTLAFTRPVDVVNFDPKDARQLAELIRQASYRVGK